MSPSNRLSTAFKALYQLGFSQTALYAFYKFGLFSGYYRRVTRTGDPNDKASSISFHSLFEIPSPDSLLAILGESGKSQLLNQADEIMGGRVRLFGADPIPLQLGFDQHLQHWTAYEKDSSLYDDLYTGIKDIK